MRVTLAFVLGIIAATTATALAGGYEPGATAPPVQGYTYNSTTGRAEVELDKFAADCKGQEATVVISADRKEARIDCKYTGTTYSHTTQLPVFQGNPQFAVVWSR